MGSIYRIEKNDSSVMVVEDRRILGSAKHGAAGRRRPAILVILLFVLLISLSKILSEIVSVVKRHVVER